MIEIITLNESEKWEKIIDNFKEADSYYTPNYVTPYRDNNDGEPILIYYNDGELEMVNVVIKRDISLVESLKDKIKPNEYFDLTTPYGYGGMLIKGAEKGIYKMLNNYKDWCIKNNIVCEFVRFHPLINTNDEINKYFNAEILGPTITVNIDNKEKVWKNYTSNNRNTIRRAKKNNVEIRSSNQKEYFNEFKRLYLLTMNGINANKYYLFSNIFYDSLFKNMNDKMLVFNAFYEDKVVASALVMFGKTNVHYYLSGSDFQYRSLNATNLLLDEVIDYSYQKGYHKLHLGGGLGSKEDSLYRFKKNFNPNSDTKFKIGKKIYNKVKYEEINLLSTVDNHDFFPKYRGDI